MSLVNIFTSLVFHMNVFSRNYRPREGLNADTEFTGMGLSSFVFDSKLHIFRYPFFALV